MPCSPSPGRWPPQPTWVGWSVGLRRWSRCACVSLWVSHTLAHRAHGKSVDHSPGAPPTLSTQVRARSACLSMPGPSAWWSQVLAVKTATVDFEFDRLGLKLPGPHGKVILSGVTGTIQHGRVTAVMGPSGAGKNCALAALARFLRGCCTAEALGILASVSYTMIVFLAHLFVFGRQKHLCDHSGWQGDIRSVGYLFAHVKRAFVLVSPA